jgi:HAD superfamily hydrolase (TIGR01549 family)
MSLFIDLDNTLYDAKFCYSYALAELDKEWNKRHQLGNFLALYSRARNSTKKTLKGHTSNRLRIIYFKKMYEELSSELQPKEIILFQELYYKYFLEAMGMYIKKYAKEYKELFKLLKIISEKSKIYILTNETLLTQLYKLQKLLPADLNLKLICSEEVGKEKPSKEFFNYAFKSSESKKANSLMIGDNKIDDIQGALNYGCKAIHQLEIFSDKKTLSPKKYKNKNYLESRNILTSLEYFLNS